MNFKKFIPQTLGGSKKNIWNKFFWRYFRYPKWRKPIFDYMEECPPQFVLEIGMAKGNTAKKILKKVNDCQYYGVDIDANKSLRKLNKRENVNIFFGDSTKILPNLVDNLPRMDLIFIDGGHDYDTCKSDWEQSKQLIHSQTAIFFHDYEGIIPRLSPSREIGVGTVVDEIESGFRKKIIRKGLGPHWAIVQPLKKG